MESCKLFVSLLLLPNQGFSPYNCPRIDNNIRNIERRKMTPTQAKKSLDRFSQKRGRGRPGVRKSEIQGRAYDYGLSLKQHWDVLAAPFLEARSEEEFRRLMESTPPYVKTKFAPRLFALIEKARKDLKFPRKPKTQQAFFAESMAGLGRVSPRRSRDICAEERKKPRHRIIRQEFYIECTCGYKGPALDGACRRCGTKAPSWQFPAVTKGLNY